MIRVALVEDHAGQRESLAELLNATPECACIAALASAEAAIQQLADLHPDVVLIDLHLPGEDGIQALRQLRARLPETQFLMLTVEEDSRAVFEALRAGANGYLLKRHPPARILGAIRDAHAGGAPMSPQVARLVVQSFHQSTTQPPALAALTPRETEVLRLLAQGYRYKEIAERLGISIGTVESYVKSTYHKLHVHSAVEAAQVLRDGTPPGPRT